MINPQIAKYIADERARGVLNEDIKKALIESGWKEADVSNAFVGETINTHTTGAFSFMKLFEGRLDNKNYFFVCLLGILLNVLSSLFVGSTMVSIIISLIFIPFGIGAGIRRWHDLEKSGWWVLLYLIPIINFVTLIYLILKKGEQTVNAYGPIPDPKRDFINALLNT